MSATKILGRRIISAFLFLLPLACEAQPAGFLTGAEQPAEYLTRLKGKRVGLLINQTSRVGGRLLVDTLIDLGVPVKTIFVPEHGFRGIADAGAHIDNAIDPNTGLPVISLYGNNKKPTPAQMAGIDILVYDLQDVGVRFYTYISTLQYAMEACAEAGKPFVVLDRANPNGGYIDGPILESDCKSFVGMQPVPIVYGMTVGEYAGMIRGEGWFPGAAKLSLTVIRCKKYSRNAAYPLPVFPSPNLRRPDAIKLYPSLCFFEGTPVSLGRGTNRPFEVWGHPAFMGKFPFSFTPHSVPGAASPPLKDKTCYGRDAAKAMSSCAGKELLLEPLLQAYRAYPAKDSFFTPFFDKLAGTKTLRTQIAAGRTAAEIRASWYPGIRKFLAIRKKYLLYDDGAIVNLTPENCNE